MGSKIKTYRDGLDLADSLIDTSVNRRPGIALGRRPAEFGGKMQVDREEPGAGRCLPSSDERLPARVPGVVRWVDASRVEAVR